jgi:hypothetical protein
MVGEFISDGSFCITGDTFLGDEVVVPRERGPSSSDDGETWGGRGDDGRGVGSILVGVDDGSRHW